MIWGGAGSFFGLFACFCGGCCDAVEKEHDPDSDLKKVDVLRYSPADIFFLRLTRLWKV